MSLEYPELLPWRDLFKRRHATFLTDKLELFNTIEAPFPDGFFLKNYYINIFNSKKGLRFVNINTHEKWEIEDTYDDIFAIINAINDICLYRVINIYKKIYVLYDMRNRSVIRELPELPESDRIYDLDDDGNLIDIDELGNVRIIDYIAMKIKSITKLENFTSLIVYHVFINDLYIIIVTWDEIMIWDIRGNFLQNLNFMSSVNVCGIYGNFIYYISENMLCEYEITEVNPKDGPQYGYGNLIWYISGDNNAVHLLPNGHLFYTDGKSTYEYTQEDSVVAKVDGYLTSSKDGSYFCRYEPKENTVYVHLYR